MSLLKRLAKPAGMEIHHIVENVKMERKEHDEICSVLNGIPIMIQASRSCASSRPRLFWCSFEVTPLEGETFEKNDKTNVLHMKQTPASALAAFWDPKWGPHKDFQLPFPCIVSGRQKPQSPKPETTVGYNKTSDEAKQRRRKTAGQPGSSSTRTGKWLMNWKDTI